MAAADPRFLEDERKFRAALAELEADPEAPAPSEDTVRDMHALLQYGLRRDPSLYMMLSGWCSAWGLAAIRNGCTHAPWFATMPTLTGLSTDELAAILHELVELQHVQGEALRAKYHREWGWLL